MSSLSQLDDAWPGVFGHGPVAFFALLLLTFSLFSDISGTLIG
jgi:hypothetical protein